MEKTQFFLSSVLYGYVLNDYKVKSRFFDAGRDRQEIPCFSLANYVIVKKISKPSPVLIFFIFNVEIELEG